jgi:hypothetical protein
MDVYYDEPNADKPCSRCTYRMHDTFLSELWCSHDPPPNGLNDRLIIGVWGSCDYWEEFN